MVSSLLYFQAKIVKDESAKKAMKEAQSRVLSMSFIHQKLYQTEDIGVIDFQNYISSLAEHICRNANVGSTDIRLNIEANSIDLSVQKSIPIGLILHELISNSVKHAFTNKAEGEINIAFEQTQKHITLNYNDSGPGARLSEDETSDTIGKKLIFLLTSQLNGSFEQDPEKLAEIHFSFRVA
ncbi:MAG: ATP-binding protein [Salibacteraceae bacterium]|nr:ATP-binding protein [Salibacteraceae bacterium]